MATFFASNINPFGSLQGGALQTTSQSFVQGNTAFASTTSAKRNVGPLSFTGAIGGGLPVEAAQQNLETFTQTTFNPLAESNAAFDNLNKQFIDQIGGVQNADDLENINFNELKYQSIDNWDSIGHMTLMSALETEFSITLETDDIIDFSSFNKGKEILKKYKVEI